MIKSIQSKREWDAIAKTNLRYGLNLIPRKGFTHIWAEACNFGPVKIENRKTKNDAVEFQGYCQEYDENQCGLRVGCLTGRMVPDGYQLIHQNDAEKVSLSLNPRCHHLICIEVVNCNPIDAAKMANYARLWDLLFTSSNAWDFHLLLYTHGQALKVDLSEWYSDSLRLNSWCEG